MPSALADSDILCQALSGAPYIVGSRSGRGFRPCRTRPRPSRELARGFVQGLWGAYGVLAALHFRAETGKGQAVDLSGAESLMMFADYNITWMHTGGKARERVGNFDPPSSRTPTSAAGTATPSSPPTTTRRSIP